MAARGAGAAGGKAADHWVPGHDHAFSLEPMGRRFCATIARLRLDRGSYHRGRVSKDLLIAAHTLGLQLYILHASTEPDFDTAFTSLIQSRAGGLVIGSDGFFVSQSERLAALAVRHAVPAIFQYRTFAEAGGLASYGGSITDYRVSGTYTGRILKGEKPANLPVQQSTKVEQIINMRTAKALGITVPLPLIGRADEVIE